MASDALGVTDLGLGPERCNALTDECARRATSGQPGVVELEDGSRVFVDVVPRQHHLLILGAGPDAVPMAPGAAHFPAAARQIHTEPEKLAGTVLLETVSAALLMTHNFNADVGFLQALASSPPRYVGLLGPTARRAKLFESLDESGRKALRDRIRGPVGLDIGGDSPASIALAAIAEIHAVLEGADAAPLSLRHSRSTA